MTAYLIQIYTKKISLLYLNTKGIYHNPITNDGQEGNDTLIMSKFQFSLKGFDSISR